MTKAGATSGDLARAAMAANGGNKPWLPHFSRPWHRHLCPPNHRIDLGEEGAFKDVPVGMVLVLEPVCGRTAPGRLPQRGDRGDHRAPLVPISGYPYSPYQQFQISADGPALRIAQMGSPPYRHPRSSGQNASVRYISWHRNSRSRGRGHCAQFAPWCAPPVRSLNSTADDPEEIGRDRLRFGVESNSSYRVLEHPRGIGHPAGRNRRALTDFGLPMAFPNAEARQQRIVMRTARRVRTPDELAVGRALRHRSGRMWELRPGLSEQTLRRCRAGGDGRGRGEHAGYPGCGLGGLARAPLASRTRPGRVGDIGRLGCRHRGGDVWPVAGILTTGRRARFISAQMRCGTG